MAALARSVVGSRYNLCLGGGSVLMPFFRLVGGVLKLSRRTVGESAS